jgi:hypothetical protein
MNGSKWPENEFKDLVTVIEEKKSKTKEVSSVKNNSGGAQIGKKEKWV